MAMGLGSKNPVNDINVTPLIDVVLVLLIIFMVLTPLAEKQKFTRVPDFQPEAQPVPPDSVPPDQTILTVLKDGNVLLNKQPMTMDDAMKLLGPAYEGRPSKVLFFNAEDEVKYALAMKVLDAGRIGIAALAVGLAQGAFEAARDYALERHQFGQPIAAFQAIRWKLADNATRIEAARLLTYRAAAMKDEGKRTTRESAIAKLFASEIAVRAAEDGVQIFGGYGFVKDYPVEKLYRDAKIGQIYEGTSNMQLALIARQLLPGLKS